ncbi:MAG TPA: ABC transporter ATP-binding protein [Hyphomicrobiales bacterium]|nr:ABC transporter ATP-binding protein [Hyphomicrobiales bacterium]
MALLEIRELAKEYHMGQQTLRALDDVSLAIERNEYVAITGSSGSGKSTMLNILGCLDRPSAGTYVLNARDVSLLNADQLADIRNREIGFIFQSFNLLPRATALANVMQPLIYRGIALKQREARASEALHHVGLGDRMDHLPNQLSGGQRQRVAIARALVTEPSILLADEPTGNLDSRTTAEIMKLFDELHAQQQTIIIVTHEAEIADHCQRIIRMEDGHVAEDRRNAKRQPS